MEKVFRCCLKTEGGDADRMADWQFVPLDQWRQREFKVGRDEAPKRWSVGAGVPLPTANIPSPLGEEYGRRANFLFCDLKMAYFVNSEVLNLRFLYILSSLSGAWV